MIYIDFNFAKPDEDFLDMNVHPVSIDRSEEITVKKMDYCDLMWQSAYLHKLIETENLIEHIKSLGGKTYSELQEEKQEKLQRKDSDWQPVETMPEKLEYDILVKGIYREYFDEKIADENFITIIGKNRHRKGDYELFIPGYESDFDDNFTITHWKKLT
jgi:hypothetical protein